VLKAKKESLAVLRGMACKRRIFLPIETGSFIETKKMLLLK
jgi:hypothetical protein